VPAFAPAETSLDRFWPALRGPAAARGGALILGASLGLAALVVAERRVAGALAEPLGPAAMLVTAAVAALLAAGFRIAWRHGADEQLRFVRWLPAAALAVLGASLWLPGASLAAVAGFWGIAIAEEAWGALSERRFARARHRSDEALAAGSRPAAPIELQIQPAAPLEFSAAAEEVDLAADEAVDHEELEAAEDAADEPEAPPSGHVKLAGPHYEPPRPAPASGLCDPPHPEPAAPHFGLTHKAGDPSTPAGERVVQQLTRSTTREGVDVLRGSLYATFPPGLRTLNVHVAFCPAFVERPRLEFRQTSGPAARIKLAQLLAFGARFDIKLAASAEVDETVVLEISAVQP